MEQLRAELAAAPPLPGAFTPKTGDLCVAKFVDGEWYRAKVEKVHNKDKITVFFVDYGNVSDGVQFGHCCHLNLLMSFKVFTAFHILN